MIEVDKLHKEYLRGQPVLRAVSFTASAGEVVGLLGPNGAGKSTLLRILAGVLYPTQGTARLCGHDIVLSPRQARAQIGYLPEQVPVTSELRVGEYLRFRAELKGVPAPRQAVASVLAEVGLSVLGEDRRLLGQLSKGFRQRVGLADALLHRPKVLLLDEPTDGLDPNQRRETLELIRRLGAVHTVLLSTHVLPEVESVCQRIVVLDRGQVVAAGTKEELYARLAVLDGQLEVVCRGEEPRLRAALQAVPGVRAVHWQAAAEQVQSFRVELEAKTAESATEELARAVLGVGELRALRPAPSSLDAVFRFLTTFKPAPPSD
jgi:ABC-2 type transport system ATP-binding protein